MNGFIGEIGRSVRTIRGNPGLRTLTGALVLAEVSAPVYYTAAGVWAFREGGAMLAAVLAIVALVPAAAVAPVAAVVTDRVRRERVMALSLASRAVFLALLAAGMALGSVWLVLAAACAASMCARVFYPALAASLPALTGSRQELVGANAVVSGTEHVGSVIGPALAGAALIAASPAVVCWCAAAVALLAAAAVARVQVPAVVRQAPDEAETISRTRELTAGFTSLTKSGTTRALVLTHVVHAVAIGVLSVAVIQLALHDLAIGAPGLGLLEGALAVGGIAGGAVALGQAARHTAIGAVRLASVLWALPLCAAVAVANPVAAAVGLAIAGIGNVLLDVTVYTHVQETTDEPVLARTVAALQSIAVAAVGLGSLAAGITLPILGTAATLAAIGLLVPVTGAILLRSNPWHAPIFPSAAPEPALQPGP